MPKNKNLELRDIKFGLQKETTLVSYVSKLSKLFCYEQSTMTKV